MKAELVKTFYFDAAHSLPNVPDGHKCGNLHGHRYRVDIHIIGPIDPVAGWVMDFGQIKQVVGPLIDSLDHAHLNDITGLENSTSELMAVWLFKEIKSKIPQLSAVTIYESETARCTYRGE